MSNNTVVGGGGVGGDDLSPVVRYANRVFTVLLFASLYILLRRRKEKAVAAKPGSSPAEIAAAISLAASLIWLYLLPVFGIGRIDRIRR